MKVFDAHAHLGADVVFDVEVDEARLLEVYAANGVDGALVQPFCRAPIWRRRETSTTASPAFAKRTLAGFGA